MNIIQENQGGTVVGAGVGLYKGIEIIIQNFAFISIEVILQAGILAFVGGALGWMGSELMSQIKKVYSKKNNKNDKKGK